MARQFQTELRQAVWPLNLGLSDRSGTDAAIHLLRHLTDANPDKAIVSIDGLGAFDHVRRARMLDEVLQHRTLHALIPFGKQWYATPSQFRWYDQTSTPHTIVQGDGGEQGDALMPAALYCLATHAALVEIQNRLPPGAILVAYLDDLYVVCDPTDAAYALDIVSVVLKAKCNVDVDHGKLAAWCKNPTPCPEGFGTTTPDAWKSDKPFARGVRRAWDVEG